VEPVDAVAPPYEPGHDHEEILGRVGGEHAQRPGGGIGEVALGAAYGPGPRNERRAMRCMPSSVGTFGVY